MADPAKPRYGDRAEHAWEDVDWPAHLGWHRVLNRWMNVCDVGPTGEPDANRPDPVVLIHGHSGRWAHYLETIPTLARTRRVIAMDLPGFGDSQMPAGKLTIPGLARAVGGLCDGLGVARADVVGHSMGGFIAAELAITRRQLVDRLVLVAAAGMSDRYVGIPTAVLRQPGLTNVTRAVLGATGLPDRQARFLASHPRGRRLAVGFAMRAPERIGADLVYEMLRGAGSPGAAPAVTALAAYDFSHRVEEITEPTLIVWGKQDLMVPVRCAQAYADRIPNARVEVLDRTGHCPQLERPAAFNRFVQEFFDGV